LRRVGRAGLGLGIRFRVACLRFRSVSAASIPSRKPGIGAVLFNFIFELLKVIGLFLILGRFQLGPGDFHGSPGVDLVRFRLVFRCDVFCPVFLVWVICGQIMREVCNLVQILISLVVANHDANMYGLLVLACVAPICRLGNDDRTFWESGVGG